MLAAPSQPIPRMIKTGPIEKGFIPMAAGMCRHGPGISGPKNFPVRRTLMPSNSIQLPFAVAKMTSDIFQIICLLQFYGAVQLQCTRLFQRFAPILLFRVSNRLRSGTDTRISSSFKASLPTQCSVLSGLSFSSAASSTARSWQSQSLLPTSRSAQQTDFLYSFDHH